MKRAPRQTPPPRPAPRVLSTARRRSRNPHSRRGWDCPFGCDRGALCVLGRPHHKAGLGAPLRAVKSRATRSRSASTPGAVRSTKIRSAPPIASDFRDGRSSPTWSRRKSGGSVQDIERRLILICLPNSAPRFQRVRGMRAARASDSGRVGHGPQTTVYLPSEPGMSRVTWHRWGDAGTFIEPIAGPDRPVSPEEFPYPSTVTGAVPAGEPVTVSWAAAGAADTTAQTAAVDRNIKTRRFI